MQDDKESWLSIGQILYEPLIMNRFDGIVYRLDEDGTTMNDFGELDFFLKNVVFGSGYCKVIMDMDGIRKMSWEKKQLGIQKGIPVVSVIMLHG